MNKEKVIVVNEKSYSIPFPKIREQFNIERRKHLLAANTYGEQERANTEASIFNINLIDAFAHISILCPKLLEDISGSKEKDIYEMDLSEAKWVVYAYSEFADWYLEIKNEVNSEMKKSRANKESEKA